MVTQIRRWNGYGFNWLLSRLCRVVRDDLASGVNGLLYGDHGFAIKGEVGKEASGAAGIVEDIEKELAIVLAHAGASPNDLFEFSHRIDDAGDDDVFHGGHVYAGG